MLRSPSSWLVWVLVLLLAACGSSSQQAPPQPAASPPATAPPPHGTVPPKAPPAQAPAAPTQPPPPPTAGVSNDPISTAELVFLRRRAQEILVELVAALPAHKQQRVAGIPLVVDDSPGEVNAFAACANGKSAMAITDGLLQIQAALAQAQAHDEVFQTNTVDTYIHSLATSLRPGRPVPAPPAGLFPGGADQRVLSRQHQVFDEQVAFVLGHELGHHHLGHLPCTAGSDPLGAGEVARVLSSQVPLFNQPNEVAADLAGTYNVLDAGRARQARGLAGWSEGGGLLTMRFFAGFGQLSPADILTAFERSHPHPQLRTPIIQQAAGAWRSTGGNPFPVPGF